MTAPTPTPTEYDRSRAAQMIAYAVGELDLRDAIARAIADARAAGHAEARAALHRGIADEVMGR